MSVQEDDRRHEGDEDDETIEARARAMGWFPEDEWDDERAAAGGRKKPQSWLSAEEYIRRTEERTPAMRGTMRRMAEELAPLKEQNAELQKQNAAAMQKLDDLARLTQNLLRTSKAIGQREYERGKADATAARRAAIEAGDVAEVDRADQTLRDLEILKPEPEQAPPKKPVEEERPAKNPDATIQAWVDSNGWFRSDTVLNSYMTDQYDKLTARSPGLSTQERLDRAKQATEAKFPEKFGHDPDEEEDDVQEDLNAEPDPPARNERRRAPASVGSSSRTGARRGNGRTWADVPSADKAEYEKHARFMRENTPRGQKPVEYTKEEFLAGYRWE